ncbi:membrane-bound lytic murein transglycosylase MltF [Henriciella litoralis]|uniref:membrane-bound lytic murein transglycosylase MltF n=1 Tax=Henriciella litoralis TaxID=568102 RepID=UPI0009FFDD0E|nr:membrane-bound lytic murein transglycosylase MltF [Henriciella litoralis]
MNHTVRNGMIASVTILAGLGLTQCSNRTDTANVSKATSVEAIQNDGDLIVLTLEGPTTYRGTRDGPVGYEAELVQQFADTLGVTPKFIKMNSIDELLKAMEKGRGHIAAAGLTITEMRGSRLTFGPAYKEVSEIVVCGPGVIAPKTAEDLLDVDLTILASSSYQETLETLRIDYPQLEWSTQNAGSAMPIIRRVETGAIDCTVADSHLAEYARRLFPDLKVSMSLTKPRPLGWVYNEKINGMDQALAGWFIEAHASGYLAELDESWFGHLDEFDYIEVLRFVERVNERLPEFRTYFETAASETEFDWHLLAAQAYQESHWDPDARSPTGVRGLMMLTNRTASEVGVTNRLDPAQSVKGGAEYLQRIYDRLPEDITGKDRTWFALAAYNIGLGHVYDARKLAVRQGLDPSSWDDIERMLPLLTRAKYYQTVKHGYARGYEPVRYVERIRDYYGMLRANVPV